MPQFKLVLYTQQHIQCPVNIRALQQFGMLGIALGESDYNAGSRFIELLTFLGCSPNIQTTANADQAYCHIVLPPAHQNIQCLGHTASATPRCPHCHHKIKSWKDIPDWHTGSTLCSCPQCQQSSRMLDLKWKQEAGYGVMAIEIFNIHPFEAVPSEELLLHLKNISGAEWDYFYATTSCK